MSKAKAIPLGTFAERAWYAYLCLPRVKEGKPPPIDQVMGRQHSRLLHKLFKGHCNDPRQKTRELVAEALRVPRPWLDLGTGACPRLTGPYRPMPRDQNLRHLDRAFTRPHNLQIAVWFLGEGLDRRAAQEVARHAQGNENARSPIEWGGRLCVAHVHFTGRVFDLRLASPATSERRRERLAMGAPVEVPRRAS